MVDALQFLDLRALATRAIAQYEIEHNGKDAAPRILNLIHIVGTDKWSEEAVKSFVDRKKLSPFRRLVPPALRKSSLEDAFRLYAAASGVGQIQDSWKKDIRKTSPGARLMFVSLLYLSVKPYLPDDEAIFLLESGVLDMSSDDWIRGMSSNLLKVSSYAIALEEVDSEAAKKLTASVGVLHQHLTLLREQTI